MDPNNIQEFIDTGVVVIENVFSDKEVESIRNSFHHQLFGFGINHENILAKKEKIEGGIRSHGRYANIFYNKWKLDAVLDQRVYNLSKSLILSAFNDTKEFDDVVPYIDRVCYRLPDSIRAEGGLGLHIDRNPLNPLLLDTDGNSRLRRWRPVQSFICLTDHFNAESGGLKVVKGFHKISDEYFSKNKESKNINDETGEFFRMHSKSYAAIENQLEFVYAPKGSVVYFDNRLPHATCDVLAGDDTREVIYFAYIPNTKLNMTYWKEQKLNIEKNIPPPMYIDDRNKNSQTLELVDRDWEVTDLNELQRQLIGL